MKTALAERIPPSVPPVLLLSKSEHDALVRAVADAVERTITGAIATRIFHGERLRAVRRALGVSQARLSGMLGIYQPDLSGAENGRCLLSVAAALKLTHLCMLLDGRNALESISGAAITHALSTHGGNNHAAAGTATTARSVTAT